MVVAVTVTVTAMVMEMVGGGSWCVAKIGVSEEVLQRALDSACGDGGADCAPIQSNNLCFFPNTLQAHASYAFNSFYQRNGRASNACLFDGASTIAQTDPSACSSVLYHAVYNDFFQFLTHCLCLHRLWILRVPVLCNHNSNSQVCHLN